MAGIVEGFRACLFVNSKMDWGLVGTSWLVTLAVFIGGVLYFRSTEKEFADII